MPSGMLTRVRTQDLYLSSLTYVGRILCLPVILHHWGRASPYHHSAALAKQKREQSAHCSLPTIAAHIVERFKMKRRKAFSAPRSLCALRLSCSFQAASSSGISVLPMPVVAQRLLTCPEEFSITLVLSSILLQHKYPTMANFGLLVRPLRS